MDMTVVQTPGQQYPTMPNFVQGTSGFAHTIDSAMHVLDRLCIVESRLNLRMAGAGRPSLQILRQSPPPGTPLTPAVTVTLWIAGFGCFEALPLPMRESGGEAEMGTREIAQLFDDPMQKTAQWLRAGAPLFQIGPEKIAACRRWLALFGIDFAAWPEEKLYPLALLAPTLPVMAAREIGIRLAFLVLLGLPVHTIEYRRAHRLLNNEDQSLLGSRACRLGRDFLIGDGQLDIDSITIRLGPVSLDTYTDFQSEQGRRLIQMTADLCVSAWRRHSIAWVLDDARQAPRLGSASKNSRLGLNFHLGRGAYA